MRSRIARWSTLLGDVVSAENLNMHLSLTRALTNAGYHWRGDPEVMGLVQFVQIAPTLSQHLVGVVAGHANLDTFNHVERVNYVIDQ